jgi:hypothetical protein
MMGTAKPIWVDFCKVWEGCDETIFCRYSCILVVPNIDQLCVFYLIYCIEVQHVNDNIFRRRVRIKCDPQLPVGNFAEVEDLETGKAIMGITEAEIHLKAGDLNRGELICVKMDEQGRPIPKDDYVELETIEVEVPEVDLTVYQVTDIRELFEEALTIDGEHHKQWYLWKIAEMLAVYLDIEADKGVAP